MRSACCHEQILFSYSTKRDCGQTYPNYVGSFFPMCKGSGWYGVNNSYGIHYRNSECVICNPCFLCPLLTQLLSEVCNFMCSLILLQVWH